jgi:hypothetical protein
MMRRRAIWPWLCVIAVMAWTVPIALADECPERIAEAQALIGQAEQALATGHTTAHRVALQAKLEQVKTLVDEAQTLHDANDHDASVEKAYAALAGVKEVLNALKP